MKVPVKDVAVAREAILRAGAQLEKERHIEEDTFFDLRSRVLTSQKHALRLRRKGRKTFLTFKGAPQKSRRFKVREEHETEVRNEKVLRRILRGLGFVAVFKYKKHRTVFRRGRLRISLDETPAGAFCEFEGERSDIVKFARTLGFKSGQMINQDYVQILTGQGKKG